MSDPMPPNTMRADRLAARIRRAISVTLSALTIAVTATVLWIYITRPSTYLSEGSFGLEPLPTALFKAAPHVIALPIASLLLIVAVRHRGRADRLPLTLAFVAGGLSIAYVLYPILTLLLSFAAGMLL